MSLNKFKRKEKYFQSKKQLRSIDIDFQFNELVDYLNIEIVTAINNLIMSQFQGPNNPILIGSFLTNVGDGTLDWSFISNDNFQKYGISLSKLEKGMPNSLLVVTDTNRYVSLSPEENNQVLISVLNNTPKFSLIYNDCFEDRCILGKHIQLGTITEKNITSDIYYIPDNTLPTEKFANNSVRTGNLTNNSITFDRFSPDVQLVFDTMVTASMIPDNYINAYFDDIFTGLNVFDPLDPISVDHYRRITTYYYHDNVKFNIESFETTDNDKIEAFGLNSVMNNSINANRLQYTVDGVNYLPDINTLLMDGSILPRHLDADLRNLFGI